MLSSLLGVGRDWREQKCCHPSQYVWIGNPITFAQLD